ncbi:MAG: polyribonucleotide nucleotidyltransferase [Patescibacteria group bacterium]|nr:polyribonucleotide nucleotidyltransferase [Patescibacteria group bacterium]
MSEKFQEQRVSGPWLGRELSLRAGKVALQADAAVIAQYGETVVLATVVEAQEERNIDYFPLTVDFEERLYAAGIIKGSRWIKREGRPTDESILNGRMVDRSLRPLFSGVSRKDTQIVCTVLSYDTENNYDIVGLVAASAALSISGVEWKGPVGGVKVGLIDGNIIFNPTYSQMATSQMELTIVGTKERTIMIEASANEVKEEIMLDAISQAQIEMQPAIELINAFKKKVGVKEKIEKTQLLSPEQIQKSEEKKKLIAIAEGWLKKNVYPILFDKQYYTKGDRKLAVAKIEADLDKFLFDQGIDEDQRGFIVGQTVEGAVYSEITKQLLDNERRVDGRKLDEIRPLYSEVNLLPRNHGSGLFMRGETQILSIITLGAPGLEQNLEGLEGKSTKRFMHHYNFPSYSVGETGPNRGPGRREIGHGALAEKALLPVVPEKNDFPYTIRVVSETMGSNGSSSMASTCCASLSLMDAGVPIKRPVAGVAIGLASNADMSQWKVLTDIQDLEDGQGGMDFKITGTSVGITAIQLDTKTDGLTMEIVEEALERGRKGRMQILEVMTQAIPAPRAELSKYAPRVVSFAINPDKIRDVIGAGGKIINKIIEEHEVEIDIEDDGMVFVTGSKAEQVAKAVDWIKNIAHEFKVGEIFTGPVARILDFGAFVELTPGSDGMVHVSKLAPYRVGRPGDLLDPGMMVTVKIDEIDEMGRINLSMKDCPENAHLWVDKKGEQKGDFNTGFRPRRDFGDRGGNRGPRRERR